MEPQSNALGPFHMRQPQALAPDLTPEQRAAMSPIDVLVQYIMPKLWDKVNFLEYDLKVTILQLQERLKATEKRLKNMEEVNTRLLTALRAGQDASAVTEEPAEKPKRGRRRKVEEPKGEASVTSSTQNISAPVSMGTIARYDVDSDEWAPKVVGGVPITARVVRAVLSPNGETENFPPEVAVFVYDMSEDARNLLCATFPDENQEEPF